MNRPSYEQDKRSTAGRGADARGDTGTQADAERRSPHSPQESGDVGGIPATVDAGVRDRLGGAPGEGAPGSTVDRRQVRGDAASEDSRPRPDSRGAGGQAGAGKPSSSDDKARDEGPLESLGKSISESVTGSPHGR
jgi:hypothetical protein